MSTTTEETVAATTRCRQCGIPSRVGGDGYCDDCRPEDDARENAELASHNDALGVYHELERRIQGCERDAIAARWAFGRALLKEREANGGKKLPDGRLEVLANALAIASRTELKNRMQFAAEYTDPALARRGRPRPARAARRGRVPGRPRGQRPAAVRDPGPEPDPACVRRRIALNLVFVTEQ